MKKRREIFLGFGGVRISRRVLAGMVALASVFYLSASLVRAQISPHAAPLNPKFLDYMAQREAARLTGGLPSEVSRGGPRPTGYIPSPIDYSFLRVSYLRVSAAEAAAGAVATPLPSSFDLRKKNKVSPVRDQGDCGSCWAFGALASVESHIMPTLTNFSPQFIIDTHGFNAGPCVGGNENMAMADILEYGAISESQDPYHYWWPDEYMTATSSAWTHAVVPTVKVIAAGVSGGTPITSYIKNALYNDKTAVAIGFYIIEATPYLHVANNKDVTYYSNGVTTGGGGHAVAIVGWDDNYPLSNFGIAPPGNGAYLVKNSWGPYWGNGGYFWMSYYEPSVNPGAYVFFADASPSPYTWQYQLDPLGWTSNWGYSGSGVTPTTAWMANVFKGSPQGRVIRAVSFYTVNPNTEYTVQIYDKCPDGEPTSGNLLTTQSGTFATAGYNTVNLKKPVTVSLGTSPDVNFSVVVEVPDTTGYHYPMALGNLISGNTVRMTVARCETYASPNGAPGSWFDLSTMPPAATGPLAACIKAFGTRH